MTETHSPEVLKRAMDKVIGEVFMGKDAFLAAIMCNMELKWDTAVPTACTNGKNIRWGPNFFMKLPHKTRVTIQLHEIWHVARLHMLRRGTRDRRIWNYACDLRINDDLEDMGYSFDGSSPWVTRNLPSQIQEDLTKGMPEEDIYDVLIKHDVKPPPSDFEDDFEDSEDCEVQPTEIIDLVRRAHETARSCGGKGISGDMVEWFDKFLAPVIPWEQELEAWFIDLNQGDYSYARPNRRYSDLIMPTIQNEQNRLDVLNFYVDVSGSITPEQIIRFNSELKHIKESFNPQQLNIVLFDVSITDIIVVTEDEAFDRVQVTGGGGTSLRCVHDHIEESCPTAAIIFSDLVCTPMEPLSFDVPVLWVVVDNQSADIPFGRAIHIKE